MKNESRHPKPPGFSKWLLKRLLPRHLNFNALDDYEEMFNSRAQKNGVRKARMWYRLQTIKYVPYSLKTSISWSTIMLKNYLKIAARNIIRKKSYSFINIFGLAVGIACCLAILLYVQDEMSYDNFHENGENIYRVVLRTQRPGGGSLHARSPVPMAAALKQDYPEINTTTRIWKPMGTKTHISYGEKQFDSDQVVFADPNFFDVFSFKMITGNPETALAQPKTIVITEETAKRYFNVENPMGKTFTVNNNNDYIVTGVVENVPGNSHFHFDFLASYITLNESRHPGWGNYLTYTYVVLNDKVTAESFNPKFPGLMENYFGGQLASSGGSWENFVNNGFFYHYSLQPLKRIHLYSGFNREIEPQGDITYVIMFVVIASFILIIACINFMNLATARYSERSREIGVRKVLGSHKRQLINQFLTESVSLSMLAFFVSLILAEIFVPTFNRFAGKQLSTSFFYKGMMPLILVSGATLIGVIAGSYPAFFLSSFRPIATIKGNLRSNFASNFLRNGLVSFQFGISIALIIGTAIVYQQVNYLMNKKLGFDKDQIIVLEGTDIISSRMVSFKEELLRNTNVIGAANFNAIPGRQIRNFGFTTENNESTAEVIPLRFFVAGYDFIEALGAELKEGRSFLPEFGTDSLAVILNEQAVKDLGFDSAADAIDKRVKFSGAAFSFTVIGVIQDFNFESLHKAIAPMGFFFDNGDLSGSPIVTIRIKPENISESISFIENTWKTFAPGRPFVYSFLSQELDAIYKSEHTTGQLLGAFSLLSIFVAALGLFGLSAFTIEQRTKEIGIRKVLGATVSNLLILLSKDFSRLVVISFVIASPIAYYFMASWLNNFAYRINVPVWIFITTGAATLTVAILTVSYQTVRSALANPIKSLRSE